MSSAKKNKANNQEQLKAQIQKQKALSDQYKSKMKPFVKYLKSKGLKFNHARVGNSRIQYFRTDQFDKLLKDVKQQLQKNQDLLSISKQIREEFIYFARPSHVKAKYPNVLEPLAFNHQGQKKFASFRFDTTQSKKSMTIGLILIFLSLVLFPIWPYELKYAIWLVSLILLIVLVGLIVLRLIIYAICIIFGYNVWIFPNLMGEYGFWQSFKPIIYYQKWEVSLFNVLIRVFVLSSLIAYGCYLYLNPDVFYGNIKMTQQTISDIHDWGVQKIKNQKNFSQRAITDLGDILNQTADVAQDQDIYDHTAFPDHSGPGAGEEQVITHDSQDIDKDSQM